MKRTALFGLKFGRLKRHGEWSEERGTRQSMKPAARAPILFAVTGIDFFYGAQMKKRLYDRLTFHRRARSNGYACT
jgi:hypothetical protein